MACFPVSSPFGPFRTPPTIAQAPQLIFLTAAAFCQTVCIVLVKYYG